MKPLPSQGYLKQILDYDPATGVLLWRNRPELSNTWNSRYAGQPALAAVKSTGYLYGNIDDSKYMAHRVIWKIIYGEDPISIDHINGDSKDNRICNLRNVDQKINTRNCKKRVDNQSGVTGVTYHRQAKRWAASVRGEYLGLYKSVAAAEAVVLSARGQQGFSPRHGT